MCDNNSKKEQIEIIPTQTKQSRPVPKGLQPFQKGHKPINPGRHKLNHCISDCIRAELNEPIITPDGKKMTRTQLFAKALVRLAIKGLPAAIKEVCERAEGKVTQPIEGSVNVMQSVTIELIDQARQYIRDNPDAARHLVRVFGEELQH